MEIDLRTQLQRYLGLDERELLPAVTRMTRNVRTLIDIGANDGLYTMHFLALPASRVVACEPGHVHFGLVENARANGHEVSSRFVLETRLVGDGVGEVSVKELLQSGQMPAFVKVDVDGVEVQVLNSSEGFERLDQVSWLVETHSLGLEEKCQRWFRDRNYTTKIVYPAWWRKVIPERRPLEHNRWLLAEARQ